MGAAECSTAKPICLVFLVNIGQETKENGNGQFEPLNLVTNIFGKVANKKEWDFQNAYIFIAEDKSCDVLMQRDLQILNNYYEVVFDLVVVQCKSNVDFRKELKTTDLKFDKQLVQTVLFLDFNSGGCGNFWMEFSVNWIKQFDDQDIVKLYGRIENGVDDQDSSILDDDFIEFVTISNFAMDLSDSNFSLLSGDSNGVASIISAIQCHIWPNAKMLDKNTKSHAANVNHDPHVEEQSILQIEKLIDDIRHIRNLNYPFGSSQRKMAAEKVANSLALLIDEDFSDQENYNLQ